MLLDSIPVLEVDARERIHEEVQEMLASGGSFDADVLFLGAGPGGYVGALQAGRMGARTVVVEKGPVGGTCLNVGCIPTKALLSTVEVLGHVKRGAEFGVKVDGYSIDFAKMIDRKNKVVLQGVKGVEYLFKKDKVTLVRGEGRLVDSHTVEVKTSDGGTQKISAKNIVIATGSVAATLPMPGFEIGETVWTSTEALSAKAVPQSLMVIGGGYVGLELGYTYQQLGSQVTVVEMLPQCAGTMDAELAAELEKSLKKSGMKILTSTAVVGAEDSKVGKKVKIKLPDGKEDAIEVEKVLISIGRRPFIGGLGVEEIGIKTERGRILVNDKMETNIPGVYAIGDCIGNPMLAHAASHEALVAVANILGHEKKMDYKAVPGVVFTHPEVASVGITEADARKKYGDDVLVGRFPFAANGKARGMGETEGFAKVIAEPKYKEVVGVHIIGPHATDMIAEAVVAMQSEATIDEIIDAIHPHPTLTEPVQEAALDAIGMSLHKP